MRFGDRWEDATRQLRAGMSIKAVKRSTGIYTDLLAALRDSLGLLSYHSQTEALRAEIRQRKAETAALAQQQDQAAHEQSIQRLALENGTQDCGLDTTAREGPSDSRSGKITTPSEILQYRAMLKAKIPIAKRAKAWSELVSQDKNLIAKLRALELTDELCGYSAPKGAVNEAPLFQLEISQQVSVQPPEPKT